MGVNTSRITMYTGTCLLAVAALLVLGEAARPLKKSDLFNRRSNFYRTRLHKKQVEGDFCENHDPCGEHGDCCSDYWCATADKPYTCYCEWPFSGEHCDKVCAFDVCNKRFWDGYDELVDSYIGPNYSGSDSYSGSTYSGSGSGSGSGSDYKRLFDDSKKGCLSKKTKTS